MNNIGVFLVWFTFKNSVCISHEHKVDVIRLVFPLWNYYNNVFSCCQTIREFYRLLIGVNWINPTIAATLFFHQNYSNPSIFICKIGSIESLFFLYNAYLAICRLLYFKVSQNILIMIGTWLAFYILLLDHTSCCVKIFMQRSKVNGWKLMSKLFKGYYFLWKISLSIHVSIEFLLVLCINYFNGKHLFVFILCQEQSVFIS